MILEALLSVQLYQTFSSTVLLLNSDFASFSVSSNSCFGFKKDMEMALLIIQLDMLIT